MLEFNASGTEMCELYSSFLKNLGLGVWWVWVMEWEVNNIPHHWLKFNHLLVVEVNIAAARRIYLSPSHVRSACRRRCYSSSLVAHRSKVSTTDDGSPALLSLSFQVVVGLKMEKKKMGMLRGGSHGLCILFGRAIWKFFWWLILRI